MDALAQVAGAPLGGGTGTIDMSVYGLFMQADWVVKGVMIGLLAASIYVWAVIATHGRGVSKMMKASERFERDFWRAGNIDKFYDENGREELPSAKVLGAGISEWRVICVKSWFMLARGRGS